MRSVLVALAVIIGELVPRFDLVMGIIGGTLTGPLIFILPPLFYSKISKMEQKHDRDMRLRQRVLHNESHEDDSDDDIDGEDSDFLPQRATYGTFAGKRLRIIGTQQYSRSCLDQFKTLLRLLYSDCVLSIAVVVFGLTATFAATYFSIVHVSSLSEFWSPCIHNISYSFMGL